MTYRQPKVTQVGNCLQLCLLPKILEVLNYVIIDITIKQVNNLNQSD